MARSAFCRVAGYRDHAAHVDADRRQSCPTLTPWINHSWHVTLYVTSRGLTTSPIPYGARTFEITFDFIDHQLRIDTSDGEQRTIELKRGPLLIFIAL